MNAEIIIIGAGVSGLMTARTLAQAGKKVLMLEARDRAGGRTQTVNFGDMPVELGAEFVHGDLPITKTLLALAGIDTIESTGEMLRVEDGKIKEEEAPAGDWKALMRTLKNLKEDVPLETFLTTHFPGAAQADFRKEVIQYAEGFDAADATKVSAKALYEEWSHEEQNYRVQGGYGKMIDFMLRECTGMGVEIIYNMEAKSISYPGNEVHVSCNDGAQFAAGKVIVAVPVSLLQQGKIKWQPELNSAVDKALHSIGMGFVVKLLLQFKDAFWLNDFPEAGFFFSDEVIPTWWTQHPSKTPLLTGWVGGRKAQALKDESEADLLEAGLRSLAAIFGRDIAWIKGQLAHHSVCNWSADPLTCGAYAYSTPDSKAARIMLAQGVEGKIFFAGEMMYEGPEMGTVEAALTAGINAARTVLGDDAGAQ